MADIEKLIRRSAAKWHVDPKILRAQLVQESGLREGLTSGSGARDIAQFIPSTAKAYGVKLGDNNPSDDIDGAAHYMADNLKQTGGDYKAALSIYNSGKPDAYKDPGFAKGQTYNYVRTILANAGTSGGGSTAPRGSSGESGSTTTPTSKTTPGQSFQADRSAAALDWLKARKTGGGMQALLALSQVPQDTPATTTLGATQAPSTAVPSSSGGGSSSKGMSRLLELFWQGQNGVDVKNGSKVPQGFVSGHQDHVHVAAGPKTVKALGQLAQSMGLHVGENPNFGGVNPVHVQNSYHYKGEAIDVSAPMTTEGKKLMAHYAATVAHKYGIKVHG